MRYEITRRVLESFEVEGVAYIVFGGVAINLLGLARATEDLDVFIEATEENVVRLKRALFSVFRDDAIDEIAADDLLGEYPAIQYVPPDGDFHVDILTRLGEAWTFEDLDAIRLDLGGVTVTVASPETLYRMKKDTVRPRDRADAEALRRRFGLEE